jgi:hypothetical protein
VEIVAEKDLSSFSRFTRGKFVSQLHHQMVIPDHDRRHDTLVGE